MPIDDSKVFTIGILGTLNRMKKWSVIYGSRLSNATDTQLQFLAEHFDLIDCNPYLASQPHNAEHVTWIKNYAATHPATCNPDIKAIGYHYGFSSKISTFPEDWYIHYDGYADFAHRVYETGSGGNSYVMNPKPNLSSYQGQHGWRDYFAALSYTDCHPPYQMYDGSFDDNGYDSLYWIDALFGNINVFPEVDAQGNSTRWTDETGSLITQNQWGTWMFDFYSYQQSVLGNKISMINCGYMGETLTPSTNWMCFEHFIHTCRAPYTSFWGGTEGSYLWGVRWVNLVHTIQENGGYTGLLSGCAVDAGYNDWALYCYCCGLLACVSLEKTLFAWNFYGDDSNNGYLPLMDTVIGAPVSSYTGDIRNTSLNLYTHPSCGGWSYCGGVFAREFQNYWVVVNFAPAFSGYNYTWTDPTGGTHIIGGKKALLWHKV